MAGDYGERMLRYGLDNHRGRIRDAFAEIAELYIARRAELQALWVEGPRTVIHGDPHLGNLFDDHGRVGFLDWGIVSVSTPMRDVGYFLTMAMDPGERRAHERDLLRHYLEVREVLGGSPIDGDEAWFRHRLHAAYTVPASCQVVTFPDDITEERRAFADAFLERSQSCVEDLDALGALREAGI
jgi:aminoglycoside phosphotransferase (APT) family kinase protein